jgi:Domain of unknown function (DUF3846)
MKAYSYIVIKANGEVRTSVTQKEFTLEQMQQIVGGYIERVTVLCDKKLCDMIVNEEGALRNLPINTKATEIYHALSKLHVKQGAVMPLIFPPCSIYGDVIIFDGGMK